MKKPMIDPSLTNEKKIKKLTTIVERLTRRSNKIAKAIIPPIPISNCISGEEVKGDILKYMFCCPGKVKKGGIYLNAKPESGVVIKISIDSDIGSGSVSYIITRKNLIFEPDLDVDTWNRLTVSIQANDSEKDKITEVWIGLLWIPTIKDSEVKNFLIEELDKVEENVPEE